MIAPRFLPMEGVASMLKEVEKDESTRVRRVLEYVGIKTIEFLRSFTDQSAPPIRLGDPPRRRHVGYWADRKGALAAAYAYAVQQIPGGWELILTNSMDYAVHLEHRDGYFVLSGVTDKGGPVEKALRQALVVVAPGWELRSFD